MGVRGQVPKLMGADGGGGGLELTVWVTEEKPRLREAASV